MPLKKGTKIDSGYSTIDDDGVNYRDIAETMSELGFKMNHSSARNYVIRVMKKYVVAILDEYHVSMTDEKVEQIAKSPSFQRAMSELLQIIEAQRRIEQVNEDDNLLKVDHEQI